MATNPFATSVAADHYARGRPDYSRVVTPIIRRLTGLTAKVPLALDVGSGTGISTKAVAPLADQVVGVEPSPDMIELAPRAPRISYRQGTAEQLPIGDSASDLIVAGSALHWFDRELFLAELDRVARPNAWFVVLDHFFRAQIVDDDSFQPWIREVYLTRFPPPARDRSWRPPDDFGPWQHHAWERYEHAVSLSADGLATYLLTQSNLQAAIERRDQTPEALRRWIVAETRPFFAAVDERQFVFGGIVATHQRT